MNNKINKILSKHADASFPRSTEVRFTQASAFEHSNFVTTNISFETNQGTSHEVEAVLDTGANAMVVLPENLSENFKLSAEPESSMLIIGIQIRNQKL